MKRFDKKITVLLGIILCFIIGGTLSFESLARFTKKFDASKKVSSAKFEVNAVNTFKDVEKAMPGEEPIAEDKITLSNENDYPVEFTVKLKSENGDKAKDLLEFLNLTITIDNEIKEIQDEYVITLEPNTVKDVFAKIEWKLDENGEVDADKASEATVKYSYDIKAKQLNKGNTIPGGDDDSSSSNEIVLYDSKFGDLLFEHGWKVVSTNPEFQNKVKIEGNSLLVGANSYLELSNENLDLNNQKLIFTADIEVLDKIGSNEGNGLNFAIGVRNSQSNYNSNNFTYHLYNLDNELYIKMSNSNNSHEEDVKLLKDSNDIKINNQRLKLVGEVILNEDENLISNMGVTSINNNEILKNRDLRGKGYSTTNKIYVNIDGMYGGNGVKINSLQIKGIEKL